MGISPEWYKTTLEDLETANAHAQYLRQRFGSKAQEACSAALKAARDPQVKFKLHLALRELRRTAAREAMAREAAAAQQARQS